MYFGYAIINGYVAITSTTASSIVVEWNSYPTMTEDDILFHPTWFRCPRCSDVVSTQECAVYYDEHRQLCYVCMMTPDGRHVRTAQNDNSICVPENNASPIHIRFLKWLLR